MLTVKMWSNRWRGRAMGKRKKEIKAKSEKQRHGFDLQSKQL